MSHTSVKENKYVFYSDIGHGWLKVSLEELGRLGIADRISPYSYLHQGFVYLEEDRDASTFNTAKEQRGEPWRHWVKEVYQKNTPIRHYSPYYHPDYVSPFENIR